MVDTQSIFDYFSLNKHTYGYAFFLYNNLFPEEYEYEDMQYEPYTDQIPTYLEAFEMVPQTNTTKNKTRQMNYAFSLEDKDKEKYDVKIPGEIEDPVLKLNIKTMKPASGIFLGRLRLGSDTHEFYNVRIDFYKQGLKPILEIKVCNRNCLCRVTNEKMILRIIKLCNMSSPKFIKNQIKSLVKVTRKVNGDFCDLMVNKNIRIYNHRKQDYINLMLCNEILLRRSIQPQNQFQSIILQENFGRVLVSVTEFRIDTEVIDSYNQFSHIYGNKHLDQKTRNMLTDKSGDNHKYFEIVRYWKIKINDLKHCQHFNTILSYKDLKFYYETQVFDFFESNPNIPTPNLVDLLECFRIFKYRTPLGVQLYWRFPIYKKPAELGDQPVISTKQLKVNKIYEMIHFYRKLQDRIDEFNDLIVKEENIPLSLNRQQKKKLKKAPPVLSLRPKYIIETSLPLFNDLNVLTVASTEQEIVLQRPKYFEGTMFMVTITLHRSLE